MRKMRRSAKVWVVYKSYFAGPQGPNAVCEQGEWNAMEQAEPGRHTLICNDISSEAEAERVARESPGGTIPGKVMLKAHLSRIPALGR